MCYVDFVKFLNTWVNSDAFTTSSNLKTYSIILSASPAYLTAHALPSALTGHNERVFNYYQTTSRALKQAYHLQNDSRTINQLINLNTKRGYRHKAYITICSVLQNIHNYFEEFNVNLVQEFPNYNTFFEFSRDFPQEFYKPAFLIKYVYLYLELIFLIKRVKPKKKLKKKKIQPKLLVSYLPSHVRPKITIRLLNSYINSSAAFTKDARLTGSLLYLILSGKNSFLYKKKLALYNRLLEKKKFY